MRYEIFITFTTDKAIPPLTLKQVATDCFVQLEGLQDRHGIAYSDATLHSGRWRGLMAQLANALKEAAAELGQYDNANESDGITEKARLRIIARAQKVLKLVGIRA